MKNRDKLVLLMVLIMFGLGYKKLATTDSSYVYQYAGEHCGGIPGEGERSNIMTLDSYKFVVAMYDQYIRFYGCRENTCNGEVSYVDEFSCEIWEGNCPTYRPYWYCTAGTCECKNPIEYMSGSGHKCYEKGMGSWSDTQYEQTGTQPCFCGGANAGCMDSQGNVNWGASYKVEIYKNGVLMDSIGHVIDICSNQRGSISWEDDFVDAHFGNQIYYGIAKFECMVNSYKIKTITTTSPTTTTIPNGNGNGDGIPVMAIVLLGGLGLIIIKGKKWLR